MPLQKTRRYRGVFLTAQGWNKLQTAKTQTEFKENAGNRFTLEELSERMGLSLNTITKVLGQTEPVDKQSLQWAFRAFELELSKSDYIRPSSTSEETGAIIPRRKFQLDGESTLDTSTFCGRSEELIHLKQWILTEQCRLVLLLGLGGIGKSTLAAQLTQQIQTEFEVVVWRSLQNAPLLEEWLASVLPLLLRARGEDIAIPSDLDGKLLKFIESLRSCRCLLILDNAETILNAGQMGQYRGGYEGYGHLFKSLGESSHRSCLLLTSREKPKEIVPLEGNTQAVRTLILKGLNPAAVQDLFRYKGIYCGTKWEWEYLGQHYGGNPLALKLVASTIQELFSGRIIEVLTYIQEGIAVFDDIRDLLQRQFDRLSEIEQEMIFWLVINREPISLFELNEDVVCTASKRRLLDAVQSLLRRSLIEKEGEQFFLQPVLLEYATEQFVQCLFWEITTKTPVRLKTHALIKAQAKDHIRKMQERLILKPIAEQLLIQFGSLQALEHYLKVMVKQHQQDRLQANYSAGNLINLLVHLQSDLQGCDFSYLTLWQTDLRRVNLAGANFCNTDLNKSVFAESLNSLVALAFSPDGQFLATGDVDGQIRLWMTDGHQILTLEGQPGWVWAIAFSSDNQLIASGSSDGSVRLWNRADGRCLKILPGHFDAVWSVAFCNRTESQSLEPVSLLATGSEDHTIRLWDVQKGTCARILTGHSGAIHSISFSPDGCTLASGSQDHTIRLWNVWEGTCDTVLQDDLGGVWAIAFSPDGQLLASGGNDGSIRLWDIPGKVCLSILRGHSDWIWCISFSPDGQTLASSSNDGSVRLWKIKDGTCLRLLQGHTSAVRSVVFSPIIDEDLLLASVSLDFSLRLWHGRRGICLKVLQGHQAGVWSVSFSPDGQTLASGSHDGAVRLWDRLSGDCINVLQGHTNWVRSVVFCPVDPSQSPDMGQILASSSNDTQIRLWDASTGTCLKVLQGHASGVRALHFSPLPVAGDEAEQYMLASGSFDGTIRLWDAFTGRCLRVLEGHTDWVWSVAFYPVGTHKILASCSNDLSIRLWNVQDGSCLKVLRGHTSGVRALAFSPDGRFLVSGGDDQALRLWNIQTGNCLKILQDHQGWVWSVAFSPDGQWIASGGDDQLIRLWNIQTGQCIKRLQGHTGWVSSVSFSPDGQVLASGSVDKTIKIWNVTTGKCVRNLRARRLYEGMNIRGVQGLSVPQQVTLKALGAIEI